MAKYLGATVVQQKDTRYKDYGKEQWALHFVLYYGQIDGSHHKAWVLDQVARILNDTPIVIQERAWDSGKKELSVQTGEPSQKYLDWVAESKGEYDEENECYEYGYDEGCPP